MDKGENKITQKMEDYLEAVLDLEKEKGFARVREIAKMLGVTSASVNSAIKILSTQGMVNHQKYGYITLTGKGARVGTRIRLKHDTISRFFKDVLLLDPDDAEEEACIIEHAIGAETLFRLIAFLDFVDEEFIFKNRKLADLFGNYVQKGHKKENRERSGT